MKKVIFLITVICLTLAFCKKSDSVDVIPTSLEGKWRMIMVKENVSGLITTKPSSIQGDVDIIFTPTNSISGTFMGNTPTNVIFQSYYFIDAHQTLTIPNLSMTKVMETSWGNEFVENIRNSKEYSFETGNKLNIKTTHKTLTFQKL